jgi:hypothetical protein
MVGSEVKLAIPIYLMPRSRVMELYLLSPVRFRRMVRPFKSRFRVSPAVIFFSRSFKFCSKMIYSSLLLNSMRQNDEIFIGIILKDGFIIFFIIYAPRVWAMEGCEFEFDFCILNLENIKKIHQKLLQYRERFYCCLSPPLSAWCNPICFCLDQLSIGWRLPEWKYM